MAGKRGKKSIDVAEDFGDGQGLFLTEIELMKLSLHEQRVEMNKIQSEKFIMQEQLLNLEYIKNRDMIRKRHGECIVAMERAKSDYNTARTSVQERLGVNLDDYTVNEVGQLMAVPQADN